MGTKRILALLLVVMLAWSLSACDAQSPIAGIWVGTLDYSQILQEEFSAEETWQDIPLEGICLQVRFEFQNDGSFTMQIDKESAQDMVDSLLDLAAEGLSRNLEKQGNLQMSKAELRELLEGQVDISDLTDPLEFVFGSGYYVYKDNRIYIGSQPRSLRANPEENAAEEIEVVLEDNCITVTQLSSKDASAQALIPGLLPFMLTKE